MKRRVFILVTLICALCLVAAIGLWIRSYWVLEGVIWRYSHEAAIGVGTAPGRFYCGHSTEPEFPTSPRLEYVNIEVQYSLTEVAPTVVEAAGFAIYSNEFNKTVRFPFWLITLALGALGLLAFRQTRRPRAGCCSTCGYDLRATPDRCPECGAVPAKLETKAS